MISIEADGLGAALDALCERLDDAVSRGMDRVQAAGLYSLRQTQRFNDRTGRLRASFVTSGGGLDERMLSTNVPYSVFLEFGTRTITPRPFFGDAREVVNERLAVEMQAALTNAIRGPG